MRKGPKRAGKRATRPRMNIKLLRDATKLFTEDAELTVTLFTKDGQYELPVHGLDLKRGANNERSRISLICDLDDVWRLAPIVH